MFALAVLLFSVLHFTICNASPFSYVIDDSKGLARALDGIGGLSGGGATSVLLWTYPEPQRSEILDYLFLPNFGASLHILKVEIGGDAQSTDGAEPSHMHTPWDENYERGYEWWLMKEAKQRNPAIKLYGLAWAYPQWVTCMPGTMQNCTDNIYAYPQQTAQYITKWVAGAEVTYGLHIDFIGVWNERPWNDTYIKVLRRTLNAAGYNHTQIVAPDGSWNIANDMLVDRELLDSVYAIGAHYPGTTTIPAAIETGKALWASEDDSTYNNGVGAGCWARILNQNYVNGNMTASINWNLITSYMKGTNWYRAGLMNAMQPWVGSYGAWNADESWTVGPLMWATAHTTQFTEPDKWWYLHHGSGAGHLDGGGSYVTLKDAHSNDFTIIIEKMSREHSSCVRPSLPDYNTTDETVVMHLRGSVATAKHLHVWATHFAWFDGDETTEFDYKGTIAVSSDNTIALNVTVNSMYTLTTLPRGHKGAFPKIPHPPRLFPAVFTDDLERCRISGEGRYFSDQNGAFECVLSGDPAHGIVMQQMVPLRPVTWGGDIRPHSLLGHRDTKNMSFSVDAFISEPTGSVMIGVRMQGTDNSRGMIFGIDASSQTWGIWSTIAGVSDGLPVNNGTAPPNVAAGIWNSYRVDVNGTDMRVWINGVLLVEKFNLDHQWTASGHALIGTLRYGDTTQFDNFVLYSAFETFNSADVPQEGSSVCVVECNSEVGVVATSQWSFAALPAAPPATPKAGLISLRASGNKLCLSANATGANDPWWLLLAACNASDVLQQWSWSFDGIAPDDERTSSIQLAGFDRCIDIYAQLPEIGAAMDAWQCNSGENQAFFFDYDSAEIANEATATCLGMCP